MIHQIDCFRRLNFLICGRLWKCYTVALTVKHRYSEATKRFLTNELYAKLEKRLIGTARFSKGVNARIVNCYEKTIFEKKIKLTRTGSIWNRGTKNSCSATAHGHVKQSPWAVTRDLPKKNELFNRAPQSRSELRIYSWDEAFDRENHSTQARRSKILKLHRSEMLGRWRQLRRTAVLILATAK